MPALEVFVTQERTLTKNNLSAVEKGRDCESDISLTLVAS